MDNPVRKLRRSLNLSQQKFADLVGRSYASIQGYEAGKRVPQAVVDRMVEIASERGLENIALELRSAVPSRRGQAPRADSVERRKRAHVLIDTVLNRGERDLDNLVISLLERLAE